MLVVCRYVCGHGGPECSVVERAKDEERQSPDIVSGWSFSHNLAPTMVIIPPPQDMFMHTYLAPSVELTYSL